MNANVDSIRAVARADARHIPVQLPTLSPTQQDVFEKLEEALSVSSIVALIGPGGSGRSLILEKLAIARGGRLIDMGDVFAVAEKHAGAKWEEAFESMMMEAFDYTDLLVVDDYTALSSISGNSSTRGGFFGNIVARRLCAAAVAMGKSLVFVGPLPRPWESASDFFGDQAAIVHMRPFDLRDYAAIAANILGAERVAGIDFKLVYRYASVLQGHQLRLACLLLADEPALNGEKFIECLEDNILSSNTRISEVEALSFDALPGSEHIVEALETHIVLPFENRQLAQELGLKPKRGVLLYGPPGTGKTSIGRALAHRMKGKFFLVDGSFISEPPHAFFEKIQKVVTEAKENSPSVLFIDDADVLFKIDHIAGLVRYLLSLLDGLESETASNVCVMMTAMDVKKIPDALLRSGRVELWLETHAPDEPTRARILERWMGTELPGHEVIDYKVLAARTGGFTPADLRRIAGDAKSLYAADLVANAPVSNATDYLARAVSEIIMVRNNMATLLGDETLRVKDPTAAAAAAAPR